MSTFTKLGLSELILMKYECHFAGLQKLDLFEKLEQKYQVKTSIMHGFPCLPLFFAFFKHKNFNILSVFLSLLHPIWKPNLIVCPFL